MKNLILIVVACCCVFAAYSQQVSRSLISSAGKSSVSKSGVTATWSVGEVFGSTAEHGYYVTEGFQQGVLLMEDVIVENDVEVSETPVVEQVELNVKVYPTIVSERLYFELNTSEAKTITTRVVSLNGQLINVASHTMEGSTFEISNVNDLPSGTYFLQVAVDGQWLNAEKFIKK